MIFAYSIIGDDFSSAGEASIKIKKNLQQVGVPSAVIRKVAISVYEAEMNIVIHANEGEIILEILSERIKVIAKDRGPGIKDIDLAMQEGYTTATEEIRRQGFGAGMGLPNIKKSADELYLKSTVGVGTELKMIFIL